MALDCSRYRKTKTTSPVAQTGKNPPAMRETGDAIPGVGRSPGRGCDNPLQYSDLENPHGQRSLAGYSPWGCKDSDATERPSPASMAAVDIGPALVCEAATCYRGKLKHRLSNLPKATQLGGSRARN